MLHWLLLSWIAEQFAAMRGAGWPATALSARWWYGKYLAELAGFLCSSEMRIDMPNNTVYWLLLSWNTMQLAALPGARCPAKKSTAMSARYWHGLLLTTVPGARTASWLTMSCLHVPRSINRRIQLTCHTTRYSVMCLHGLSEKRHANVM
jgi:hypothetical protein